MKQATIVNDEGERRCLFDNVDAAFRVGDRPATLDAATTARLERFDVDDLGHVDGAVRLLARRRPASPRRDRRGAHLPRRRRTRHSAAALATTFGTIEPPTGTTTQTSSDADRGRRSRCAPLPGARSTRALIRQIVDEERNPTRVAALATGLGMSYRETVAACAQLGLDQAFTAQVAVDPPPRRHHPAQPPTSPPAGPPRHRPKDGPPCSTPPGRAGRRHLRHRSRRRRGQSGARPMAPGGDATPTPSMP